MVPKHSKGVGTNNSSLLKSALHFKIIIGSEKRDNFLQWSNVFNHANFNLVLKPVSSIVTLHSLETKNNKKTCPPTSGMGVAIASVFLTNFE